MDEHTEEEHRSIKCKNCGERFTTNTYWQKFCGVKCRNVYHNTLRSEGVELAKQERKKREIDRKEDNKRTTK